MDDVACWCTNFRRAALALTARYDEALAPHGLKVTQFSLLRAVQRRGRANLTELSGATGLDRSTLGRNLRRLEESGLVLLAPGDDHRDRVVALTRRGRTRVEAAALRWAELQASIDATLGEDAARIVEGARRVTRLAGHVLPSGEVGA
jgi:DNA-binding MarR family transcriptional regulator